MVSKARGYSEVINGPGGDTKGARRELKSSNKFLLFLTLDLCYSHCCQGLLLDCVNNVSADNSVSAGSGQPAWRTQELCACGVGTEQGRWLPLSKDKEPGPQVTAQSFHLPSYVAKPLAMGVQEPQEPKPPQSADP